MSENVEKSVSKYYETRATYRKNNTGKRAAWLKQQGPRYTLKYKLRQYNMTLEQYDALLEKQGGVCAICKRPETVKGSRLGVDHDHETLKVRGLLCRRCNVALGAFDDSPEVLTSAVTYLAQHKKGSES